MDNWIDVVLRGMGVLVFACICIVAAPLVIFFAMLIDRMTTG